MSEVLIDGVRYVPEKDIINIKAIETIIKAQCKYLSEDAINDIIRAFEAFEKPSKVEIKKPRKSRKSKYNGTVYDSLSAKLYATDGIKLIDSRGKIYWKNGSRIKKPWTIHDAMSIRAKMNDDRTDNLTKKDISKISEDLGFSCTIVARIMYNIEYGELGHLIDNWVATYGYSKPKKVPIVNNPQKRKSMGY